ncbi:MAG: hypothetical protein Q9203_001111 [Teloschistes exilis]
MSFASNLGPDLPPYKDTATGQSGTERVVVAKEPVKRENEKRRRARKKKKKKRPFFDTRRKSSVNTVRWRSVCE